MMLKLILQGRRARQIYVGGRDLRKTFKAKVTTACADVNVTGSLANVNVICTKSQARKEGDLQVFTHLWHSFLGSALHSPFRNLGLVCPPRMSMLETV